MSNDMNTPEGSGERVPGRARKHSTLSYGMGPVIAGAALTVALVPVLAFGGSDVIRTMVNESKAGPPQSSTLSPVGTTTEPTVQPTVEPEAPQPSEGTVSPTEPSGSSEVKTPSSPEAADPSGPSDSTTTPDRGSDQETSTQDTVYYVAWGDTLASISTEFGISVDRLMAYNGIDDVNTIYADSALRIPYVKVPVN